MRGWFRMTLTTCVKDIEWNYKIQNWRLSGHWCDSLVILLLTPLRHLAKKMFSLPVGIEISQCIRCSTTQNMYWSSGNLHYVTLGARQLYNTSVCLLVLVRTELVQYKAASLRQHTWCPESWMLHIRGKKKATNKQTYKRYSSKLYHSFLADILSLLLTVSSESLVHDLFP